jgi:H/ACA ribonucleoprotein complex subunit 3
MMHILKCKSCGTYGLTATCTKCGGPSVKPKPPKYSPEDKYGEYRRQYKEEHEDEMGDETAEESED